MLEYKKSKDERMPDMNGNGYNNNPFEDDNDYLFKMVTNNGRRKTYGWSVASMVSGILALICCCFGYTGVVFGALAIIFSVISRKNLGYFDGMAIAGLVTGIIGFILGAALIIFAYSVDEETFNKMLEEYLEEYENMLPEYEGTTPDA